MKKPSRQLTLLSDVLSPSALSLSDARPSNKRSTQLAGQPFEYRLHRSKRRSIGFLIDDEGLRVTAPKWVTLNEIEQAIRCKQRWIFLKLQEYQQQRLRPKMLWRDGSQLHYLGEQISICTVVAQAHSVDYDECARELDVTLPIERTEQHLKDAVQTWLQSQAKKLFAERLPLYARQLGVQYHSFALSSAATQWGSCNANGRIRLNWRLVHFPLLQIDYVIAHELAHLREMNHSPRFWALVQSIFPEFEEAKRALREQAHAIPT